MAATDITEEFCKTLKLSDDEKAFEEYLLTKIYSSCSIDLTRAEKYLNDDQITQTIHACYALGIEIISIPKGRLLEVSQIFGD